MPLGFYTLRVYAEWVFVQPQERDFSCPKFDTFAQPKNCASASKATWPITSFLSFCLKGNAFHEPSMRAASTAVYFVMTFESSGVKMSVIPVDFLCLVPIISAVVFVSDRHPWISASCWAFVVIKCRLKPMTSQDFVQIFLELRSFPGCCFAQIVSFAYLLQRGG